MKIIGSIIPSPATQLDFYKVGHYKQYPNKTRVVYSNLTARAPNHSPFSNPEGIVFIGLQKFLIDYLINEWHAYFFDQPKEKVVGKYKRRIDSSLGEGSVTYDHIEALHDLGYMPLKIKALPEGSLVDFGVPCVTIQNTLDEFFWLTNYIETVFSAEIWKPCTVATIAREYKKILSKYAHETGTPEEFVPFQCHDFSMRGMSGRHDAATSGLGHLASFVGSDNIPAIDAAEEYYDIDPTQDLIGTSIPATEHSVMCAGTKEGETETYRRLMTEVYPSGMLGIVSDTWDFFNVVTNVVHELHSVIEDRDGKVVFRPDSGDPVKILTGYTPDEYEVDNGQVYCKVTRRKLSVAEIDGAVSCLYNEFGGTRNAKGYIDLNPKVGLIYGESITIERCKEICERLKAKGFSSGNVVFGVGSYTYQHITRDCFSFAVKATFCLIDEERRAIFKDPVTDNGSKKSATGLLMVGKLGDKFFLKQDVSLAEEKAGCLETVFCDSKLITTGSCNDFAVIRKRVNDSLKTFEGEYK